MCLENFFRADQREVGEVLVVNRIELIEFDEPKQMWKLQRQHALGLEQNFETLNEIVQVRNLGKNIVSQHQVGCSSLRREFVCDLRSEKTYERWNTFLHCRLGH